jgi:signal transduction histidine kinase
MLPRSIRWRLPLTYAAIASIAALTLGAVLLTTLRSYYAQTELQYLQNNAQAVRDIITELQSHGLSQADISAQLQNLAFLSQVQIQLLDADRNLISNIDSTGNAFSIAQSYSQPVVTTETQEALPDAQMNWVFAIPRSSDETTTTDQVFTIRLLRDEVREATMDDVLFPIMDQSPAGVAFPARRTLFGLNLYNDIGSLDARRSDQSAEIPLSPDNPAAGYIRLAQGPTYGAVILDGVAQAWLLASVVAILIAGAIGLYISQRISAPLVALTRVTTRMSDGELSARAVIGSRDEVGTLASAFNEMAERVEETILTLRRFVADAAHELHTPLTALRTNIELIADEKHAEEQRKFVERALSQVNRLETLTVDLLELSRLEAGKENGFVLVDLNRLIRETSELYASRAEQADIEFHIDLPISTLFVHASESQIRRALCNLLENAIKFTPAGGTIHVGLRQRDSTLELWVQDTGIGIPDDDLPQLFSRFHRGRNAFAYPGSGLGLAIVRAITDAHSGSVAAEQLAPGTRITLRLPTPG